MTIKLDIEKCGCNTADALPPHQCPFKADVHDDTDFACNCCEACTDECAMDI
jgi:hypothetical protein